MSTRASRMGDKAMNEKHAQILKALMQRPDNRKCVDCRKKDPRWASWNLGIFMCIRCSGVHRSLGTHISKVKSADLDSWTPEQIENMVKWGNAKANHYWENQLPPDMDIPESNIEQWIRAKYERKQYAMKGPIPDPDTIALPGGISTSIQNEPAKKTVVMEEPAKPAQPAPAPAAAAAPAPRPSAADDLFGAFSAPAPAQQQPQQTNIKADILSLYSNNNTQPKANMGFANFNSSPNAGFANFSSIPPQPTQSQGLQGIQFFGNSAPSSGMNQMNFGNPMNSFNGSMNQNQMSFNSGINQNQMNSFNNNSMNSFPTGMSSNAMGSNNGNFSLGNQAPNQKPSGTSGGIPDFINLGGFSTSSPSTNTPTKNSNADIWGDFQ